MRTWKVVSRASMVRVTAAIHQAGPHRLQRAAPACGVLSEVHEPHAALAQLPEEHVGADSALCVHRGDYSYLVRLAPGQSRSTSAFRMAPISTASAVM